MRSLGLMATRTLTFFVADIEGSAAMARRSGDVYARVLAAGVRA
jgi:class 3 adenylate cyclase